MKESPVESTIAAFVNALPSVVGAILILIVGWIIAGWIGGLVARRSHSERGEGRTWRQLAPERRRDRGDRLRRGVRLWGGGRGRSGRRRLDAHQHAVHRPRGRARARV